MPSMPVYKRTGELCGTGKKNPEIGNGADCERMAASYNGPKFTGGKALSHQRHIVAILALARRQWENDEVVNGSRRNIAFEPRISMLHRKRPPSQTELDFRELNRQVVGQVIPGVTIAQKMRIEADDH